MSSIVFARQKLLVAGLIYAFCMASALQSASDPRMRRWTDRLIPLPKEISIDSSITIRADKIKVADFAATTPRAETALWLLKTLTAGGSPENPQITFSLHLNGHSPAVPAPITKRLGALPNGDQAYAIVSRPDTGEIMLIANDAEGLFYAVRTILQLLLQPGQAINSATALEIPWAQVMDWPDMKDRGAFCAIGGFDTFERDFQWMGRWKLNCFNRNCDVRIDNAHSPEHEMFKTYEPIISQPSRRRRQMVESAFAGVRMYAALNHIEQTCLYGGLLEARTNPAMKKYLEVLARQDPNQKFDPYMAALSVSNPATIDLLAAWFEKMAELSVGHNDRIIVWLTENRTYCHDDMRKAMADKGFYDHYVMELEAVMQAMERARRKCEWLKYDIGLSQGCRLQETRERILKMVPADVGVHYYDGTLTYTSSKNEIIFPELAEFARAGGRAGVVPTITHACEAVVPWTGLDYIHFRCNEFVDKGLQSVFAFIQPDRYHCEQELMALAEWSWNAGGRTPAEFAEAYAAATRICNPKLYSQWAVKAGNAGWLLADSRFLVSIHRNPAQGLYANQKFGDTLYGNKDINDPVKFQQGFQDAVNALALAYESGVPAMITESEVTYAALATYAALGDISGILRGDMEENARTREFGEKLNSLDEYANLYRNAMHEWTQGNVQKRLADGLAEIHPNKLNRHMPLRLQMVANALRRLAALRGIPDPRPLSRGVEVAEWSLAPHAGVKMFEYDISTRVPLAGGWFNIGALVATPETQVMFIGCDIMSVADTSQLPTPVARWKSEVSPFYIPPRAPGVKLVARHAIQAHYGRPGAGHFVLTQVYIRGDYPRGIAVGDAGAAALIQAVDVHPAIIQNDQPVRVGVLQGVSAENLMAVLRQAAGLEPVLIEDATPENLAKTSVLIFDQLAARPERMLDWMPAVKSWTENGGGVMFIHDAVGYRSHIAMFPQGGHGVDHLKHDKVEVVKTHPITEGFEVGAVFNPGFAYDHIVMEPGGSGDVLLVSEGDKRPALIAGIHGQGRYVLNGMLTGGPADRNVSRGERRFDGDLGSEEELKILLNAIKWLMPRRAYDGAVNMMKNPGAEEIIAYGDYPKNSPYQLAAADTVSPGWGAYRGVGRGVWGSSAKEARSGKRSVFLRFADWQELDGEKQVNIGLLLGEGCGYRASGAIPCAGNTDFVFSLWLKGNTPIVKIAVMGWDKAGRREIILLNTLKGMRQYSVKLIRFGFPPEQDWAHYEGSFSTNSATTAFHLAIFIPNAPFLRPGQSIFADDAVILPVSA